MTREFGDVNYWYGALAGYVVWDGTHVLRTDDILADPPTWEEITGDVTGTIYDGAVVVETDGTPVVWLLTSTALWVCDDISAVTPAWTAVLTPATVQASDADPTPQTAEMKCMATYAQDPDYCIVATGPTGGNSDNKTYAHAYFWHTHDRGDTWTSVDVGSFTGTSGAYSYVYAPRFGMEVFPSLNGTDPGPVYCIRFTPQETLATDGRVFRSDDLGHTWDVNDIDLAQGLNNRTSAALSAPSPTLSDYAFLVKGDQGASDRPDLYRSADEWSTQTQLTANGTPTGYGGVDTRTVFRRVGKRYDSDDYLLIWLRNSTAGYGHLMESSDAGSNFGLLYDPGAATTYASPVNWPPDPDTWVMVIERSADLTTITNAVLLTEDGFATAPVDKSGNLDSLLTDWTAGLGGGFAIPKPSNCKPRVRYLYNGTEITDYCNAADLETVVTELPKPTLADTAAVSKAGLYRDEVRLQGDWNPTIHALLAPAARRGTQTAGEIIFDDCQQAVSYAWATGVKVAEWRIKSPATGKIVFSAVLRHNAAGVRTVS